MPTGAYYAEVYKQRPSVFRWAAFRWRIRSAYNGQVVASSSESYTRKEDAYRSLNNLISDIGVNSITDIRDASA